MFEPVSILIQTGSCLLRTAFVCVKLKAGKGSVVPPHLMRALLIIFLSDFNACFLDNLFRRFMF
jgi:hypothetical protein